MEIVRGVRVVPHIPLVLSKIVIYIQTSCALTLSYPAVGERKLQARAMPITLEGKDRHIQVIAPHTLAQQSIDPPLSLDTIELIEYSTIIGHAEVDRPI